MNRHDYFRRFVVTSALVAAVCGSTALAQHGNTITPDKQGVFAVPKMAKPPVVDGAIDPAEWKEALAIGGLASQNPCGNQFIMRPTTYYLAWDADNLYVACRTWIMPGYKPRVSGRAPGTATAFDDCKWYGWDGYRPRDTLIDWGLNDERLRYVPHWRNTAITSADPEVLVAYWQLPGRVFAMAFNHDGKEVKNAALKVDFAALALTGGPVTVRELRGIDGHNGQLPKDQPDPAPTLDAGTSTVAVPGLEPHTARYIGLRVSNPAELERLKAEFQAVGNGAAVSDEMLDWGLAEKPMPIALDIDLEKLGLVPQLPWQELVRVRDFEGGTSKLDFHGRKLDLGVVPSGKPRLVGVRKY
jgi:hypothetical protein